MSSAGHRVPVHEADAPLVSVVMPCLDEEEAIGGCIEKIQRTLAASGIDGEIIVCDNGSTDRSVEIAESMGVRVVHQGMSRALLKLSGGSVDLRDHL